MLRMWSPTISFLLSFAAPPREWSGRIQDPMYGLQGIWSDSTNIIYDVSIKTFDELNNTMWCHLSHSHTLHPRHKRTYTQNISMCASIQHLDKHQPNTSFLDSRFSIRHLLSTCTQDTHTPSHIVWAGRVFLGSLQAQASEHRSWWQCLWHFAVVIRTPRCVS